MSLVNSLELLVSLVSTRVSQPGTVNHLVWGQVVLYSGGQACAL